MTGSVSMFTFLGAPLSGGAGAGPSSLAPSVDMQASTCITGADRTADIVGMTRAHSPEALRHPVLAPAIAGRSFAVGPSGPIDPAKGDLPKIPSRFAPYIGILQDGVRTEDDLHLANELRRLVNRDDAGHFADKTEGVPRKFVEFEETKVTGGTTLGAASLNFSRCIERRAPGRAEEISLAKYSNRGLELFVPVHEDVHAIDYNDLPSDYKEAIGKLDLTIPDKTAPLVDIYRAILKNRFWDEALAFGSAPRFAKDFESVTGCSIFDFEAQTRQKEGVEELVAVYNAAGFQGVYDWVESNHAYLPYKVAALYLAMLVKKGQAGFPDWNSILCAVGAEKQSDGAFRLNLETLSNLYRGFLRPYVADIFFVGASINPNNILLLQKVTRFFTGGLTHDQAIEFMRDELDGVVELVGEAIADPMSATFGQMGGRLEPADEEILPARPSAMPKGDPSEIAARPETVADKAMLAGSFVEHLYRFDAISDKVVVDLWGSFIDYALRADPETSSKILSRLAAIAARAVDVSSDRLFAIRYDLGIALMKIGERPDDVYYQRGRALVKLAFDSPAFNPLLGMKDLVELGEWDLLEAYFDWLVICAEPSLEKLEKELDKIPDEFIRPRAEKIENLIYFLNWNFNSTGELPEGFRTKIRGVLEKLWTIGKRDIDLRIAKYRELYVGDNRPFESIEEMTAVNPQWYNDGAAGVDDASLLLGKNVPLSSEVIDFCAGSKAFCDYGLEMLKQFPASEMKLSLLRRLAWNSSLDPPIIDRVAAEYECALDALESGYRAWSFTEDKYRTKENQARHAGAAAKADYRKSHQYLSGRLEIAKMLLDSSDPRQRRRGVQAILSLPEDATPVHNIYESRYGSYTRVIPALWKADAIIRNVGNLPEVDRRGAMEMAERLLSAVVTEDLESYVKGELYLNLIQEATRNGHFQLAIKLERNWAKAVRDELKGSIDAKRLKEAHGSNVDFEDILTRAHAVLSFMQVVRMGGKDFAKLVHRIASDVANDRRYFARDDVIALLQFIGDNNVHTRFADRDVLSKQLMVLARAAIDLYLAHLGTERELQSLVDMFFSPLVESLRTLPFRDEQIDEIFAYFVEEATPKEGVYVKGAQGAEGLLNAGRGVEFILGNKKTPMAEAALLDRIAGVVNDLDFSITDRRSLGVARSLGWLYTRTATDTIMDPAGRDLLTGLRNDEDYQRALGFLHAFRDEPPLTEDIVDIKDVFEEYQAARDSGDLEALRGFAPTLTRAVRQELRLRRKGISSDATDDPMRIRGHSKSNEANYVPYDTLEVGLLGQVYKDWKRVCERGDWVTAEILFEAWATSENKDEALMKRAIYYPELLNRSLPLEVRRRIFEQVAQTSDVSRYTRKAWKDLIPGDGDKDYNTMREELFYDVATPVLYDRAFGKEPVQQSVVGSSLYGSEVSETYVMLPNDTMVALGIEMPIEISHAFVQRLRRFREADIHTWKMDPSNRWDWEIYGYFNPGFLCGWEENQSELIMSFHTIAEGRHELLRRFRRENGPDRTTRQEERLWKTLGASLAHNGPAYIPRHYDKIGRFSNPYFLMVPDIMDRFTRVPTPAEAAGYLRQFNGVMRHHDLMQDCVDMRLFVMPDAFKGRGEALEFALSRYFIAQGPGKQNDLIQAMDGIPRDRALVELLMQTSQFKAAQVVSTVPGVSDDVRADAAKAQDKVPGSDIAEVVQAIRDQVRPGPDCDAILKHLGLHEGVGSERKALGSGSIGDVYWSRLANDGIVAVKVITPTKEGNFERQLEFYREVQYKLELRFDEYPWARRLHRWIDVFFDMTERERNLRQEAAAMEAARAHLPEGVAIPEVREDLINDGAKKVLIMTFAKGVKLKKITDPGIRAEVVDKSRGTLMNLVTNLGRFTADIHPGNIFYDAETGTIWLLDWGQTGYLNEKNRALVVSFVQSCLLNDAKALSKILQETGEAYRGVDEDILAQAVGRLLSKRSFDPNNMSTLVENLFEIAYDHGILTHEPFLILLKGLFTFENMARDITGRPSEQIW